MFNADVARGLTETYVLKIGEDVFTARIVDGVLEPSCGAAPDADLVVETDPETFFLLCAGQLEPKDAVKSGRVRHRGRPGRVRALLPGADLRTARHRSGVAAGRRRQP